MTALSRALKINIRVAYLDGHSPEGIVNFVDFVNTPPEDSPDPPVLLYR
jgi:ubiquitin thioesterase protein OTUB1